MNHGESQIQTSSSAPEDVNTHVQRSLEAQLLGTSNPSPEIVIPRISGDSEKAQVFKRVEQIMENFRGGQSSRFQTLTHVIDELDKWSEGSDEDREKALNTYLVEINSDSAFPNGNQFEPGSATQPSGSSVIPNPLNKRRHSEVGDLIERLSRGGCEEEEDESQPGKRHAKEEDMPWFNPTVQSTRRDSCVRTCKILQRFSEDLSGVKSLLRVAFNLPEGIPSSQWDRILRGESVDLNQILSSMHYIQLDDERKGRMGNAEVIFTVPEPKRQLRTGAEWSAAFRRLSRAITFLFPHREDELREYAEYIEGLFAAKQAGAHAKVILYDHSVRNQVGGGQNTLLTDYHKFHRLGEAILHADGIEYGNTNGARKGGPSRGGRGPKSGGRKGEICRRFNGPNGCHFSEEDCFYKHTCQLCGKGGHRKPNCCTENH
jgi:hypothetical protein